MQLSDGAVLLWVLAVGFSPRAHALSCRQIADLSAAGTAPAKLVAVIQTGPAMTADDLACVVAAGVPDAVVDAVRARVPPSAVATAEAPAAIRLDIAFVGVELGETRDGTAWDVSLDSVPTGLVALGSKPLAAGVGLAKAATGDTRLPDPYGKVRFVPTGSDAGDLATPRWLARPGDDARGSNTRTPEVPDPPTYRGWLTGPSTTFRVQMFDQDGDEAERLPPATIDYAALLAALNAAGVYRVAVGDQTGDQLRFVSVRVSRSALVEPAVEGTPAP